MKKIAIIGAGIAGTTCAYQCSKKNYDVTLFDKSRGVSGRSTSKRWDQTTGIAIDMGVPYIHEGELSKNVGIYETLIENNTLTEWTLNLNKNNEISTMKTYVGYPKMNSIARFLGTSIAIESQAKVNSIKYTNKWEVFADEKSWGGFDILILAIPAAQYNLVSGIPNDILKQSESITYQAVNTLLLEMRSPLWFENYHEDIINTPYIRTVIADYQKPGREKQRFTYAIHSQPSWATKTFDDLSKDETEEILINEILTRYKRDSSLILNTLCHRWRYAQLAGHLETLQKKFIKAKNSPLYACGDWCNGHLYTSALESGYHLAESL